MKIELNRIDDNYLFELTNQRGHKIILDNTSEDDPQGVSPMESVLMALAGCSSIDMVSILKKQRQEITSFSADVEGERVKVDEAKPFRNIHVIFKLEGEIDGKKQIERPNFLLRNIARFLNHLIHKLKLPGKFW